MLKDVTDSRRIDKHMIGRLDTPLHPTIISHLFWPNLQSTTFKMPGQFQQMQEAFEQEYTEHKAGKKLRWMNNLGTVSLDLEFEDRAVSADATPLEAAVVELFSEQDTWSIDSLSSKLGINDLAPIRAALMFWTSNGVLKPLEDGQYQLLERMDDSGPARKPILNLQTSIEAPSGLAEEDMAQQAAQMELFWNFTKGILTNLGAMPIDRIQAMLSLAPNYNKPKEQLAEFLEAARAKGFWSALPSGERFAIEWLPPRSLDGNARWEGYWALPAALNKALENGIPITDPRFYASQKDCPDSLIETVFQPASGCLETIPLLQERIRVMRQAGAILVERYNGSFSGILAEWRQEHGPKATAGVLVGKITKTFEVFRDENTYKDRLVFFWKRAQILVAETWAAFYPPPGAVSPHPIFPLGVTELTMFADYRVPQILHHLGTIDYSPALVSMLVNGENLPNGSEAEMSIRAAGILSVEGIKNRILDIRRHKPATNSLDSEVCSVLIDFFLWDLAKRVESTEGEEGSAKTPSLSPIHRTRSIWY
ncbi:unnamed protein product [Rhizoctonia solani]|uniref:Cullin family profile domain-containing protein n=1 Tax=Rhizoctonia solani TaxID=456999 RepID=A0A8H3DEA3_9AGAM|nr:unnamed protein product [Rhizoctonia solani]